MLSALLLSLPCAADGVWRCEGPSGQVHYQQSPCRDGDNARRLDLPDSMLPEDQVRAAEQRLARDLEYLEALEAERARARERAAEQERREQELELEQRRIEALERQVEQLERQEQQWSRPEVIFLPYPARPWPAHPHHRPVPQQHSIQPDLPLSLPPLPRPQRPARTLKQPRSLSLSPWRAPPSEESVEAR